MARDRFRERGLKGPRNSVYLLQEGACGKRTRRGPLPRHTTYTKPQPLAGVLALSHPSLPSGTPVAGGVRGATLASPGPESPEFSLSNRTAENVDYLYRPRRLEGRTAQSPYVGMNNGAQACQGARAQNSVSVLGHPVRGSELTPGPRPRPELSSCECSQLSAPSPAEVAISRQDHLAASPPAPSLRPHVPPLCTPSTGKLPTLTLAVRAAEVQSPHLGEPRHVLCSRTLAPSTSTIIAASSRWQRGPHRPWWGAGPSSQEKGWCEWLVPAVPKIPRTKLYDRTCIHSPTPPASRELQERFCGLSLDLQSTPESFRQQVTLSWQRPLCSDAPRLPHGAGAEHLGASLRGPRKTLTATRHQGNGRGEHRPNTLGWL
uniref:Uncharacterized protein LOC105068497 n=1 Tax=Camelus bactrianus TaxID=9837 RepID=A0A9W3GS73_CAMBA|nr:uncharacterized protein LOC105068497 [Camelus bactrianus]